MARSAISISDFLNELQSYIDVSQETMELALESYIDSKNSPELNELLNGWARGDWDEDPVLLVQELKSML